MSTFTIVLRLTSLGKIVKADTIRIFYNSVVLVEFDFNLRMETVGKVLFLPEVVIYAVDLFPVNCQA
jgi:hypothetical protein